MPLPLYANVPLKSTCRNIRWADNVFLEYAQTENVESIYVVAVIFLVRAVLDACVFILLICMLIA